MDCRFDWNFSTTRDRRKLRERFEILVSPRDQKVDPSGWVVILKNSSFFSDSKAHFCDGVARVQYIPFGNVSALDLDVPILIIEDESGARVGELRECWRMNLFSESLFLNPDSDRCNILLFGPMGSGKSTLINTLLTLLSSEDGLYVPAQSGGSGDHITTDFRGYQVHCRDDEATTRFFVIDTWGVSRDNYEGTGETLLTSMVKGKIPNRFEMDGVVDIEKNMEEEEERRSVHVVLFCVNIEEFQPELNTDDGRARSALLTRTLNMMAEATRVGVNSVLAITCADKKYDKFYNKSDLSKWMINTPEVKRASEIFNISPNRIVMTAGYARTEKRNINLEKVVYHLFDLCAQIGLSSSKYSSKWSESF